MQITSKNNITEALPSVASIGTSQADFQAMLDLAKQNAQRDGSSATVQATEKKTSAAMDALKKAQDELSDYLSKPIAQHMRDAILKEMGLTEEDVKAMPPEQQAAVEKAIADKIKERMQQAYINNTEQNYGKSSVTLALMPGQVANILNQD